MTDWIEQYSAALDARDAREQAHKRYIDACTPTLQPSTSPSQSNHLITDTRLADRTAALAAPPTEPTSPPTAATTTTTRPNPSPAPTAHTNNSSLSTLRSDLATTQKARAFLATQTADLTTRLAAARADAHRHATQITQLTRQKLDVERRLRERDEELRGQRGLVEQAQDEMVALGLQLHMAERRSEALTAENGELVARWMRRVGEEAERMNRDSRWE